MKHRRRIDRLYERRSGYWSVMVVPYISVPTEADIPAALAALPENVRGPIKIYVGVSPDDWDGVATSPTQKKGTDNEAQTTIGTTE